MFRILKSNCLTGFYINENVRGREEWSMICLLGGWRPIIQFSICCGTYLANYFIRILLSDRDICGACGQCLVFRMIMEERHTFDNGLFNYSQRRQFSGKLVIMYKMRSILLPQFKKCCCWSIQKLQVHKYGESPNKSWWSSIKSIFTHFNTRMPFYVITKRIRWYFPVSLFSPCTLSDNVLNTL